MFKLVYNAFKYVYNIPIALARFNKRIIMLHLFRTIEPMEHSTSRTPRTPWRVPSPFRQKARVPRRRLVRAPIY